MNSLQRILCLDLLQIWGVHISLATIIYFVLKGRIRRWWTKPHLKEEIRNKYGAHTTLFSYFLLHDHESFCKFTRMTVPQFLSLYNIVEHRLRKNSKRQPLHPEIRLAAFLHFVAHGDSALTTSVLFRIGTSTMYKIVTEVSKAIVYSLKNTYLCLPNKEVWNIIAENMYSNHLMPNCLGALDGKHFRLQAPAKSGSSFHNFKNFKSIILLATCDAYHRFTSVNVGDYGSMNDAGAFQYSDLGKLLDEKKIQLPITTNLPNSSIMCPYYFIADNGFPIKPYIMTPYPRNNSLSMTEKIFNVRLSHARRLIECAFGILVRKWQIFQKALAFKLTTTEYLIMAMVCIHNFLITYEMDMPPEEKNYTFEIDDDESSDDESDEEIQNENIVERETKSIRQKLKQYFVLPCGSVPWQYDK